LLEFYLERQIFIARSFCATFCYQKVAKRNSLSRFLPANRCAQGAGRRVCGTFSLPAGRQVKKYQKEILPKNNN